MNKRWPILGAVCAVWMCHGALAWIPDVDAPDLTLTISGSTASEGSLKALVTGSLCVGNTDVFEATNQKIVFCTMDGRATSVPGLGGAKKVLIRKSGVGGSGNGVGPVCSGTNLVNGFMVVKTGPGGTCVETTSGSHAYGCTNYATETLTPELGISDVAPNEVFGGSASAGCGTNVFGSFESIFAIPVTTSLRNALQAAQGLRVGSDAAADVPSMSSGTYAAIVSGKVAKWDSLNTPTGRTFKDLNGGPANGDIRVTLCRRGDTSGTFAATQIRILQTGCVAGASMIAAVNGFPGDLGGPVVIGPLSGSGDVENCLQAFNDGGTFNGRTGSNWAVGMLSTDRNPIETKKNYRFIRMNGVLPTFENVANGSYTYSVTSTIQWKSLTGDKLFIARRIQTDSATPVELGKARSSAPWGDSGLMALAENGFAVSYDKGAYDNTKPVTPYAHRTTVLSNCLNPIRVTGRALISQ